MKKFLLFVVLQVLTLTMWADSDIIFHYQDSSQELENQVPITGGINNGTLHLNYGGADYATVSVKDRNGSVVYKNYTSSSNPTMISLNGYSQGEYTIKVEDSRGNAATANFDLK